MIRARRIARRAVEFLGSHGLACILFLFLMVLTFLGTLEQADHSLHEVRTRYFDSLFFTSDLFPLPLPGAYLLLGVLFVNLLVGGLLRMRRTRSRAGIFVIHVGILVLLVSGLVEYHASDKGHMTLFEGDSSAEFRSYYDWEIVLTEPLPEGRERVYVIPHDQIVALEDGGTARFEAEGLPFHLELSGFLKNCRPRPVRGRGHHGSGGLDGFVLEALPQNMEAERDIAGVTVALVDRNGMTRRALLWGVQQAPYQTRIAGKPWAVHMRKRRWELPFRITLRKFTRELHPRTGMASSYSSDVTRSASNVEQDVHISMNEPMRHAGYTFYQSGWGPQNAPNGARLFSTFSVVYNPADQGPLIACVIIAIGLAWHFMRKLKLHIRSESKRRNRVSLAVEPPAPLPAPEPAREKVVAGGDS